MKKNIQALIAAVTLGAGVAAAPIAWGQTVDAGLARQQQVEQERKQKQEQRAENRTEQQAAKAEKRQEKHEREELANMPKPVRQTLRAETQNVTNVDYYRVEGQGGKAAAGREFGAKFTAANGHQMDVRVDREGKVLSRNDLTATAAATPATAAQTPATAAPTPAPSTPTASTAAPESGDATYRRLQATEVPQAIRTQFDQDTTNAKDVRYYRTKYGSQLAYEAKWQDPKTGKEMRHYVSDAGQTLVRGESVDDANEQLASAAERRYNDRRDNDRRDNDRDRRDSNRDRNDRDRRDDNATTASGDIKTGRVELSEMPRSVQTQMRRLTENGKDVKFYRTKYGSDAAFEAKYNDSNGKEQSIYLDQNGKVLKNSTDKSSK